MTTTASRTPRTAASVGSPSTIRERLVVVDQERVRRAVVALEVVQVVEEHPRRLEHQRDRIHDRGHAAFGLRLQPPGREGEDQMDEEGGDQGAIDVAEREQQRLVGRSRGRRRTS